MTSRAESGIAGTGTISAPGHHPADGRQLDGRGCRIAAAAAGLALAGLALASLALARRTGGLVAVAQPRPLASMVTARNANPDECRAARGRSQAGSAGTVRVWRLIAGRTVNLAGQYVLRQGRGA